MLLLCHRRRKLKTSQTRKPFTKRWIFSLHKTLNIFLKRWRFFQFPSQNVEYFSEKGGFFSISFTKRWIFLHLCNRCLLFSFNAAVFLHLLLNMLQIWQKNFLFPRNFFQFSSSISFTKRSIFKRWIFFWKDDVFFNFL